MLIGILGCQSPSNTRVPLDGPIKGHCNKVNYVNEQLTSFEECFVVFDEVFFAKISESDCEAGGYWYNPYVPEIEVMPYNPYSEYECLENCETID